MGVGGNCFYHFRFRNGTILVVTDGYNAIFLRLTIRKSIM